MELPKIEHPVFTVVIPSTKEEKRFRPFLVKEEKVLLVAKQSKELKDIIGAIKQVVNNCAVDPIDLASLATFDLEYIFIKLLSASVGNSAKLTFIDNEDKETRTFDVDLSKVEVRFPEASNLIKINDKAGIKLKYPSADVPVDLFNQSSDVKLLYQVLTLCLDKCYDANNTYNFKDFTPEQIEVFLDNLPIQVFEEFKKFFNSLPTLYHVLVYTNSKGNERRIELKTLDDFFSLG